MSAASSGSRAKRPRRAARRRAAPQPTLVARIRALDPHAMCGAGTTVMRLYRVDRMSPDDVPHLVFHDRHGWYCEHGRECPAVEAVRRHEHLGD